MKVKFKTNLGSRDAERLGLDFRKCLQGMEGDVSEVQGEALLRRNYAEALAEKRVIGVAQEPAIADAAAAELQAEEPTAPVVAKVSKSKHKET